MAEDPTRSFSRRLSGAVSQGFGGGVTLTWMFE